ncbi:hypothetical protein GALL_416810 [mine drainage metagenome]|uniref:Uncharacterized protein n=1 Tax=mine drainage metagenome TaxID=410659 RepID=A0A1J5Q058_9ZZZZ
MGNPVEEKHRDEDDADTQQGDECRGDNLVRAIHDGGMNFLALFKVPVDVFNGDRRVVHQNTYRQGQPAQGHDVQRLPDRIQRGDG